MEYVIVLQTRVPRIHVPRTRHSGSRCMCSDAWNPGSNPADLECGARVCHLLQGQRGWRIEVPLGPGPGCSHFGVDPTDRTVGSSLRRSLGPFLCDFEPVNQSVSVTYLRESRGDADGKVGWGRPRIHRDPRPVSPIVMASDVSLSQRSVERSSGCETQMDFVKHLRVQAAVRRAATR